LALAVDYGGPAVIPLHGWRIAPDHFAERYGLVVLIALGESVIAIGIFSSRSSPLRSHCPRSRR
jgi:low temperature requirement protein LtrA